MFLYPELDDVYLPTLDQAIRYLRQINSFATDVATQEGLNRVCDFLARLQQLLISLSQDLNATSWED